MEITVKGTRTGRSRKAKTPRGGSTPVGEVLDEHGVAHTLFMEDAPRRDIEIVGMHLGPRTRLEYPYSYDPILQFKSGEAWNGSVYTDHFTMWYGYDRVRQLQEKHFGTTSDYYNRFPVKQVQEFLRELMDIPELKVVRIEEHCNQSSGYPCWFIAFRKPEEAAKSETADTPAAPSA